MLFMKEEANIASLSSVSSNSWGGGGRFLNTPNYTQGFGSRVESSVGFLMPTSVVRVMPDERTPQNVRGAGVDVNCVMLST
ncbi:hypothetical protein TNCV_353381 [Trichonephila clavipes]|nr:hypothetical protein TNCV_353381 [Trichonephila clavipes]